MEISLVVLKSNSGFSAADERLLHALGLGNVCLFPGVSFPATPVLAAFFGSALVTLLQLLLIKSPFLGNLMPTREAFSL